LFDRNSGAKFLMSAPKPKQREVRSGSNSDVGGRNREIRSAPENGHRQFDKLRPKGAKGEVPDPIIHVRSAPDSGREAV
jgi:hypothetical protein